MNAGDISSLGYASFPGDTGARSRRFHRRCPIEAVPIESRVDFVLVLDFSILPDRTPCHDSTSSWLRASKQWATFKFLSAMIETFS